MIFMRADIIPYFLVAIITLFSCNNKDAVSNDQVSPVITMSQPANNQVFSAGDMVQIHGIITDDQFIAELHIHVSDNNTGALLMDIHRYPAGASFTLNEFFVASSGIQYKIQIIARDRGVNEAVQTIMVICN